MTLYTGRQLLEAFGVGFAVFAVLSFVFTILLVRAIPKDNDKDVR